MNDINKKLGKKVLFRGDEQPDVPSMKTGMPALDSIIGGGLPHGKIAEVYGLEQVGKTTLAIQIAVSAQKQGLKVAWLDLENAWDRKYAENLGIVSKDLIMVKADYGEEAFTVIEMLIENKEADIFVVDSIPALITRSEAEAEIGKPTMGGQARLLAQSFRRLIPALEKSGAILLFINQLRVNIMGGQYNPYTRPGGKSLKYYARTCIELKKRSSLKRGEEFIGINVQLRSIKSYSTSPFKKIETRLMYGHGFSHEANLISVGLDLGVLTKKGNTILFGKEKLGVGAEKARLFLKDNPETMEKIKEKL